jgi:hypothetical protein
MLTLSDGALDKSDVQVNTRRRTGVIVASDGA